VTTPGGTGTSGTNFTVNPSPAPTISSFNPTSGPIGTSVTISGAGFTGASQVSFGGAAAKTYSVDSDSQIAATVPLGAATGTISVTTPGGTGTSSDPFTVTVLPPIVILLLENTEYPSFFSDQNSPPTPASGTTGPHGYLNYLLCGNAGLAASGAPGYNGGSTDYSSTGFDCNGRVFTNYYAAGHASEDNYLYLTSGSQYSSGTETTNGCGNNDNCPAGGSSGCNPTATLAACQTQENLFHKMAVAGVGFNSFAEGEPAPCATSATGGSAYALRHNPENLYTDVTAPTSSVCASTTPGTGGDVPYALGTAPNPSSLPQFSFVTPNLCDDAHGVQYKAGSPVSGLAAGTGGSLAQGTYQVETTWDWSANGTEVPPNQNVHTPADAPQAIDVPDNGTITGTIPSATGLASGENIYVEAPGSSVFSFQQFVLQGSSFTISSLGSSAVSPPTTGTVSVCGQGGLTTLIPTGPADNCTDPAVVEAKLPNMRPYLLCLADNWLATNIGTSADNTGTLINAASSPNVLLVFDEGTSNTCPSTGFTGYGYCQGGHIYAAARGPSFPHQMPEDATVYGHCGLLKGVVNYLGLAPWSTPCQSDALNTLTIPTR
jgi:hypothetical protein